VRGRGRGELGNGLIRVKLEGREDESEGEEVPKANKVKPQGRRRG